jgi:hypothetical protein
LANTRIAPTTGIEKAIKKAGGVTKMARDLDISRNAIYLWLATGFVTPQRAIQLEHRYSVPRAELIDPNFRILLEGTIEEVLDSGALSYKAKSTQAL